MALRVRRNCAYTDTHRTAAPGGACGSAEDSPRGSAVARRHVQDGDCLWSIDCGDYSGGDVHSVSELVLGGKAQEFHHFGERPVKRSSLANAGQISERRWPSTGST